MPRPVEEAAVQGQHSTSHHHKPYYEQHRPPHDGQHYQQQNANANDYPPHQQQQGNIYNAQSLSNLADVATAEAADHQYATTAMTAADPPPNNEKGEEAHTEGQQPPQHYPYPPHTQEHFYHPQHYYPHNSYPQHHHYLPHQHHYPPDPQYDRHHVRPYHYPKPPEQLQWQYQPPEQQYNNNNNNISIERTSTHDTDVQEVIVEAVEYAQRDEEVEEKNKTGTKRSANSSSGDKNRKVKRVKRGDDPNQIRGQDQEGHEGSYEQHVERMEQRPHHAQAWHNHYRHQEQQYLHHEHQHQYYHPGPHEQNRPPHEYYHRPPNETGGHQPHHPPPPNAHPDQYDYHPPHTKTVAVPRIPPIQHATPVHPDTSPNPQPTYAQGKHQNHPHEHEVPPPSIQHHHTQQHQYPPPQMPPPQQQQQTNIFPPMFTHKTSQAQSLKKNKTKTTVPIDVSLMHKSNPKLLPLYKYSTEHQSKSWNEMIQIFNDFVDREGHGDVEKDDPSLKEGYNPEEDEENDPDLLLRSWIREVRWVVRAEGLGQNRDPQRVVVGATKAAAKESSDKSPSSGERTERNQKATLEPRCDSENVTEERYEQLSSIEHFPLKKYTESSNKKGMISHISSFQLWLDDLQHYRAKHDGDCNVPQKYTLYPGLGHFVNRQRSAYKKLKEGKSSSMTAIKIQHLDTVNFTWSTTRMGGNASWEDRFNELKTFLNHHGHTNVPKKHPPNPPLGFWVNEQRFQHRKMMNGKSSYMTEYRANLLNSLNFKWELKESPKTWDESIEELRQYKEEYGHVNVSHETNDRYASLVSFVNNQRDDYRRYVNGNKTIKYMTEGRIKILEELGISWNLKESKSGTWSDRFKEMKEYKKQFGNCDTTVNLKYSKNKPLSSWVSRQRHQYKLYKQGEQSTLTEEHIQELNDIGFNWGYSADKVSNKKKGKSSR